MPNTRRLARSIGVDVSADNSTWLNLPGRTDNNPSFNPNIVDATDTDGNGYNSSEITAQGAQIVVKYNTLINGGTPNPAQALVEATEGQFGTSARLYVRWYDLDGGPNGWTAYSLLKVERAATSVNDLRAVTATFTTDGATVLPMGGTAIAAAVAARTGAVAPIVLSATPSGVAVGGLVKITGQNFLNQAITSVKFLAVTATITAVESDNTIWAVMPAGTAGSAPVTVTNATGVSNSLPYTRGA